MRIMTTWSMRRKNENFLTQDSTGLHPHHSHLEGTSSVWMIIMFLSLSKRWLGRKQEEYAAGGRFHQSWRAAGKSLPQEKEGKLLSFN